MAKALTPDICVIGAGPAGIALATKAAACGASVVLVDGSTPAANLARGPMRHAALAASARHAQSIREGARFGLAEADPEIDFGAVLARVQKIVADAAPAVSVERLATLGVTTIDGQPRFLGRRKIQAGDTEIRARRYVLATGSSAVVPAIPGLEEVGYLTPDTLYDLARKPSHLVVIGGDATALELAQTFNRLGTQVTLLAEAAVLPDEDPEMASVLVRRLRAEGVDVRQGVKVTAVERRGKTGVKLLTEEAGAAGEIHGGQILVSAGRVADLETLDLKKARVVMKGSTADVSAMLRTTNMRVYAVGEAAGASSAQHAARQADLVLDALLYRLPAKDRTVVPRLVATDPPLAHVGLTEAQARRRHKRLTIVRAPYAEHLGARAQGRTEGHVKLVMGRRGDLLGATVAGANAAEAIGVWALVIAGKLSLADMSSSLSAGPSTAEIGKAATMAYFGRKAPGPLKRGLARLLRILG